MKFIKYHIVFLFSALTILGFSQDSKLTITSSSGNLFLLINNVIQNNEPNDSIHVNNIPEGSYSLKLINVDSLASAEKTIFINSNQHQQYEHFLEDSAGFIRLVGNYIEVIEDSIYFNYTYESNYTIDSVYQYVSDSSTLNDLLYQTDYNGKKGCEIPSFINTKKIITKVNNQMLTRKKQEIILSELENSCIQVSDLKVILTTIEYEDSKLNIIKLLSKNIFDVGNLNQLDDLFNIRGYKESFNEFKQAL